MFFTCERSDNGAYYCETDDQRYTRLVCACVILMMDMGIAYEATSDAGMNDWAAGLDLVKRVYCMSDLDAVLDQLEEHND